MICSVICLLLFGPDRFIIPAMLSILTILTLLRKPLEGHMEEKIRKEMIHMRSIPDSQAIALIAIMSLLTFCTRTSVPFVFLENPRHLLTSWYLGKVLPLRYHRYAGGLLLRMFPCCRHRSDCQS